MTPEIKDMKTWAEAERWLAKHGWGMSQIAQQKELWEKESNPAVQTQKPEKPVVQTQKPEKPAVQTQKPEKTDNKK